MKESEFMSDTSYRTLVPLFDQLEGERVIVRPYRDSDAEALFEAVGESREHIRPWLPFADAHQKIEETRDWIIHTQAKWLLREDMNLSIWEKASGRYLGGLGLHARDWDIRYFEIGYWLRVSAAGHGFVTEAARLLTHFALTSLQANRLEIRCDERNKRSAGVALRLGYTQEGRFRNQGRATDGTLRTTLIFALTPEDGFALS